MIYLKTKKECLTKITQANAPTGIHKSTILMYAATNRTIIFGIDNLKF